MSILIINQILIINHITSISLILINLTEIFDLLNSFFVNILKDYFNNYTTR